jgi:uncharacterized membrane protein YhaH (DUF805 family)
MVGLSMHRIIRPYVRFYDFGGRSSRSEYWLFILTNVLVLTVLSWAERRLGLWRFDAGFGPLVAAQIAVALIPFGALHVRRLHDTGAGNWLAAATLVPVVGWLIVLIQLLKKGDSAKNEYGHPSP